MVKRSRQSKVPNEARQTIRRRIMFSMPTHSMVPSAFMFDLACLVGFSTANLPDDVEFNLDMVEGTYIHVMRQDLAQNALLRDADYMLWLDTDMRFPKDALVRLLMHRVPLVGINYAHRKTPTDFVAIKKRGGKDEPATKLWTTDESTGLEEVDAIGFGLVLMQTGLLGHLGPPPWFRNDYNGELCRFMGEDVYFCERVRQAGIKILVDHDLSKECAHVGQFEYRPAHAQAWQEEVEKDGADNGLQQPADEHRQLVEP